MMPAMCPGAPATAALPDTWDWPPLSLVRATLANGLRVILAERHTVPLVLLTWTSDAGFERDPERLEGLASLTPLLLRAGTARRSGERITQELDDLGAELVSGADWESAFLNLGLLSLDLPAGAELLFDMVRAPRFPDEAVSRLRQRRLVEIERRTRDPRALASDAFAQALFGDGAYGRSPLGAARTVERIGRRDVAAFHASHYLASTSYVVVAGSFDPARALEILGSFELPPARVETAAVPAQRPVQSGPSGRVCLVDVPAATHAEIRIGHAGLARDSEHLPALEVLNAVLGGGPASRLARCLRQDDGVAYNVRSRVAARRLGGMFVVETSVAHQSASAAAAVIRREIERLAVELVPPAELEQARRALFGAELRRFQDVVRTGAAMGPVALQNDTLSQIGRRRQGIAAVEPEMLREVARRSFNPDRLVTVVAGAVDGLQPQFSGAAAAEWRAVPLESKS